MQFPKLICWSAPSKNDSNWTLGRVCFIGTPLWNKCVWRIKGWTSFGKGPWHLSNWSWSWCRNCPISNADINMLLFLWTVGSWFHPSKGSTSTMFIYREGNQAADASAKLGCDQTVSFVSHFVWPPEIISILDRDIRAMSTPPHVL